MVRDLAAFCTTIAARALAAAAGVLPRRYWPRLDEWLPVTHSALVSALATILLAASIGIPAFMRHAEAKADRATEVMLQSTGWRQIKAGARPPSDAEALATWLGAYASLVSFVMTPLGLVTLYLAGTGIVRAVLVVVDDARGDPVLTALDFLGRHAAGRAGAARDTLARERLEGPEVPDRVLPGHVAGFPEADIVIVASRRKAEWAEGAFVITDEQWFRLGAPVDRQTPGGLRTLYPLKALQDYEVLRRGVRYDLPGPTTRASG